MDYQTQIDNLIELAIVQRDELKQLVEQLPQLREYLSAEVEKKIEAIEPELRQELEEFFARKTEERVDVLRGDVSERVAEMLKSLEMAAAAKYSALMNERARNAELLSQAEQKIADAAATIPSKVKDIVLDELSRFPRANQIDQLRKEFAEPRGLNPRGKWQTGERYQKLDLVSYNGESYISNVDDNTEKPSRFSASWTLSAARGQGGGGGPSSLNDLTQPPSDGTLLIGSGTSWVNGNIIGGTGVTVTNQPGSILIDATGAQEILTATVKNAESVAITKGQVVYLFGATGNMASVKLASNTSDATSAKTFGVVSSTSISAGGTGTVTCVGVLDGLNLGTYNEGDTVYLGATPGTFTATKPYAPNHLVYVGIVERANAGNGELYVKIQNGYELDEIHDVQINAPKLAGQTLLYDATTDLWKNARLTGTANQIAVTNADAAVTLSIPTNPTLPGNVTVAGGTVNGSTSGLTLNAGGTNQSIVLNPSGTGIATVVSSALNQPSVMRLTVPGTATAGAYTSFYRTGVIEWQAGVGTDNSSFRVSPNGLGISDSLVLTNLGNATIGGTLTVNGGATAIVGAAGGTTTYTVLRNAGTNISIWGSRASIDGGNAADVGLYVYGANELSFWTNSTRSAWISSTNVFNTVGGAVVGGQLKVSNASFPDLWLQNTSGATSAYRNLLIRQNSNGTFKFLTTSDAGVLTLDNIIVGDNATGTLMFGTATNSSNGRLQLATHTAATGGIGFGTDASLYRYQAGGLALDATNNVPALIFRQSGTNAMYLYTSSLVGYIGTTNANSLNFQTGTTTALTLDSSQNATFAKDIFLGTSGPSVPSTLSGRAPRQGLVFAGPTDATLSGPTMGTQCTIAFTVRLSSLAAQTPLVFFSGTGFIGTRITSGALFWSAAASDFSSTIPAGKTTHVVVVANGTTATPYIDGVAGTAIAFTSSVGGITNLSYAGNATLQMSGLVAYNRALSAAEVKALYENGVPAAQDIVPQVAGTQLITGNNSTFAGAGSWTSTFGSGTSTVSGGKLLINGGATTYGGSGFMGAALSGTYFVKGYRYRVTVDIDALSSGTLNICEGTGLPPLVAFSGTGTKTADVLVPMSSTDAAVVLCFSVASATATIDNITLVPLGAVLAPDAAQTGGGLTWYDNSGNAANITLPASGVAWNVPTSGNVTSGGQLNLRAGGTNGTVYIAPTGTGAIRLGGTTTANLWSDSGLNLGIGTASGGSGLTFLSGSQNALFGKATDAANGRIQLADHTAITGGIGFGTDVQLFRSPSSQLRFSKGGGYAIFEVQGPTGSYVDFYASNGTTRNGSVGTEQVGTMFVGTRVSADTVLMTNGTAALTINSSQNSVFAGNIAAQGSVASDGVNGNALFGGAKRVIIGYDTTADIGNIAAVHTGTAWKALALQPVSGAVLIGKTSDTGNGRLQFAESTSAQNGIQFGTDTNLYRSAANTLTTGGILRVGGASTGLYFAENTGGNAYVTSGVGTAATGFLIGTSSSIPLRFQINSSVVGRFATSGNLLIGTETDSSNGRIQLATHTANTGGIGFGTETSLYRYQAGGLVLDHTSGTAPALMWRETGTSTLRIETNSQVAYISTLTANSLILRTNSTAALTLDSGQNASFAGRVRANAGSGASPSFAYSTELNTGFYLPYANWNQAVVNGVSVAAFVAGYNGAVGGMILINNLTTAPNVNPSGGGWLYCEGGALKYRGSSGTVTTIANA